MRIISREQDAVRVCVDMIAVQVIQHGRAAANAAAATRKRITGSARVMRRAPMRSARNTRPIMVDVRIMRIMTGGGRISTTPHLTSPTKTAYGAAPISIRLPRAGRKSCRRFICAVYLVCRRRSQKRSSYGRIHLISWGQAIFSARLNIPSTKTKKCICIHPMGENIEVWRIISTRQRARFK